MISIIMGTYNEEKHLSKSIESIVNQTFQDWELIICDDGSSDQTVSIIKKYMEKEKRIKLLINEDNKGLAHSLNKALNIAKGQWIARHDGDDIMAPHRLETQFKFLLENSNIDILGGNAILIDENDKEWGHRRGHKNPSNKNCMTTTHPFIHPTVIMNKKLLSKVKGYTEDSTTFKRLEDYDLWRKMYLENAQMANIDEPLVYYREDKNSYKKKKKSYRYYEMRARLSASKDLNINLIKRILCIKPLLLILVPNNAVLKMRKMTEKIHSK